MAQSSSSQLIGASLEELLNIQVTSVSKKDQALSRTAAAVFVINQEDIRRSGAYNIPDLLRMVPGVEVSQIDSNHWAISIRGFASFFANKVLVLIDGRSVYSNTFSGVFWDQINVPLEDIERIEVIRGPGGTVWGANAVNGVIDIITKSAADTKGVLVTASSGTRRTADGMFQYGGNLGQTGAYRVFGRYLNTNNSVFNGGQTAADGSHGEQTGFRGDWAPSAADTVSVQADFLSTRGGLTLGTVLAGPPLFQAVVNGQWSNTSGDLLAQWEHTLAGGSTTSLQIYDTAMHRDGTEGGLVGTNNTLDLDFEHHIAAGSRHDIVWGLDYRFTSDAVSPSPGFTGYFTPPHSTDNLFAAFIQDEIHIAPSVFLTLGSKLEHNFLTGLEYEPSAQILWKINDRNSIWASAARAIRQPDRVAYGAHFNQAVTSHPGYETTLFTVNGGSAAQTERLKDFEVGYRTQVNRKVSLDVATFLSFYKGLETLAMGAPYPTQIAGYPYLVFPASLSNLAHSRDYGAEVFATWKATGRWKVSPGCSFLHMAVEADQFKDILGATGAGASPGYQFEMRSMLNLRKNLEWDGSLKYVADLTSVDVPGYVRVDTRLGWQMGEFLELSITGQNLTSKRHVEFEDRISGIVYTEVPRSVFAKLTWRF
jgi:iron complex outermembrane recepter protein